MVGGCAGRPGGRTGEHYGGAEEGCRGEQGIQDLAVCYAMLGFHTCSDALATLLNQAVLPATVGFFPSSLPPPKNRPPQVIAEMRTGLETWEEAKRWETMGIAQQVADGWYNWSCA